MRFFLSLFAAVLIALGLWLIASDFQAAPRTATATGLRVTAPPKSGNPVILGTAILAGGVMFLVLVLRRR